MLFSARSPRILSIFFIPLASPGYQSGYMVIMQTAIEEFSTIDMFMILTYRGFLRMKEVVFCDLCAKLYAL